MAKHAAAIELALPPRSRSVSAYRWLYESVRSAILEGRLRLGTRMPATRDLARQYALSRGTIVNAFDQLKAEGYLEGHTGSGTYVSRTLPESLLYAAPSKLRKSQPHPPPAKIADWGRRAELFPGYESRPMRAFRANLPALDLFPTELWSQLQTRTVRRASTYLLMGCEPLGLRLLRKEIAEYLCTARGVRCTWKQVAIVSGIQEALDIVTRTFVNPRDRVCIEDPGYPGAAMVFNAYGARLVRIPVDADGVVLKALPRSGVRLLYVTPGHQFPLGVTMSLSRRMGLLAWARKSGAFLFEDDYDSEYRYAGRPMPALQGLEHESNVLFAGSFSKVLFPALRLGYLVVPAALIDRVEALKSITNRHAPALDQAVLTAFMSEGHFGRHIRRMRGIYAERYELLAQEVQARMEGLLTLSGVQGGLQTAAWLTPGIDSEHAATVAAQHGVEVTPLSRYYDGTCAQQGLQLGFAALQPREIRRGVVQLAGALESVQRGRTKSRSGG